MSVSYSKKLKTYEDLTEKHASQPFNPDIANAFFRAGLIEAWGRGFEKMQADCKAQGVPGPALQYETNGLWVEFENRTSEEATEGTREKTREKQYELSKHAVDQSILRDIDMLERKCLCQSWLASVAGLRDG